MGKYRDFVQRIGFSMAQLSVLMGYSREGLYGILANKTNTNKHRWSVAVRIVKAKIEDEYHKELAALNNRYAERRKAAEELLYRREVEQ